AQAKADEVAEGAGAGGEQLPDDLAGVVRELEDEAADVAARHARRIGGADQRADRGAGDGDRFPTHLVEPLEHGEVGAAARAAGPEREGEAPAHNAPASRANAQARAASGRTSGAMAAAFALVAVPSRTRPTMPCRMAARRKKL